MRNALALRTFVFVENWQLLPNAGVEGCFHCLLDVVGQVAEEVDACPPLQLVDAYHAALQCG